MKKLLLIIGIIITGTAWLAFMAMVWMMVRISTMRGM